jgi:hypothetical protein
VRRPMASGVRAVMSLARTNHLGVFPPVMDRDELLRRLAVALLIGRQSVLSDPYARRLLQSITISTQPPAEMAKACDETMVDWAQRIGKEPAPCSLYSLQPNVTAHPMGGLDQTLAQAALRRVEAKEFVFIEGDPTTHVFRVETGAVAQR